ncbi:MAG: SWIM zinc finger domain-containing protein [Bacteroidia bacterium]|jgi:uncharacterized Zn finger protein|nr:SWIM zinc finger domain-containing protein [Bacteroidia bacterium]
MDDNEALSLDNFRNELDENVLERGWYYFSSGWVKPPRIVLPGFYEVRVEEVNPHAVSFTYEDEVFTDIFCTCEDRTHDVCRHMAAALFYFEAEREKQMKPVDWEQLEQEDLKRRENGN